MSEFIKLSNKKSPTSKAYYWAQMSINMSNNIIQKEKNIKNIYNELLKKPTNKPISLRFVLEGCKVNGEGLKYVYDSNVHFKNLLDNVPLNETTKEYKKKTNEFFVKADNSYKQLIKTLHKINEHVNSIKNKFPLIIEAVDKNPDVILVPYGTFNNFILDTNLKEYVFTIKPKYTVTLYRNEIFGKYSNDKVMLDGMGHPYVLPFDKYRYKNSKNQYSLYKHDVFRSLSIFSKDFVPYIPFKTTPPKKKDETNWTPYVVIVSFVFALYFLLE